MIKCKRIALSQNQVAIIDTEDYSYLSKFKWFANESDIGKYYAATNINHKKVYMHYMITGYKNVDHKNGNSLDNRKSNLRICTQSQNGINREKPWNNKSGYKGVSWKKGAKKWCVSVGSIYVGLFSNKKEAALAYNKVAIVQYGEFANLNNIGGIDGYSS